MSIYRPRTFHLDSLQYQKLSPRKSVFSCLTQPVVRCINNETLVLIDFSSSQKPFEDLCTPTESSQSVVANLRTRTERSRSVVANLRTCTERSRSVVANLRTCTERSRSDAGNLRTRTESSRSVSANLCTRTESSRSVLGNNRRGTVVGLRVDMNFGSPAIHEQINKRMDCFLYTSHE